VAVRDPLAADCLKRGILWSFFKVQNYFIFLPFCPLSDPNMVAEAGRGTCGSLLSKSLSTSTMIQAPVPYLVPPIQTNFFSLGGFFGRVFGYGSLPLGLGRERERERERESHFD